MKNNKTYCYVSSWEKTYGGNDGDGGITVFELKEDGSLAKIEQIIPNLAIGYLSIDSKGKCIYGINETKKFSNTNMYGGSVLSFKVDKETGKLKYSNTVSTVGVFPCFIAITKDGSSIFVTNYGSTDLVVHSIQKEDGTYELVKNYDEGSVVMLPVDDDGQVCPVSCLKKHVETSVDPLRQVSVHPHSVNVDNSDDFIMVCDRGGDRIYSYKINKEDKSIAICDVFKTRKGTGPRHLSFHPEKPWFYVVSELLPLITSYEYDIKTGKVKEMNILSTEPLKYEPSDPTNFGACTHPADVHVHPNGKFVYASNRGHNSISVYHIDENSGELEYLESTSTQGLTPRTFAIAPGGKYLLAANQDTGNIVSFVIQKDGRLEATGSMAYSKQPVCLKFLEVID